ncbi:MAG: rRNA maturation RNase YbeY [candidate division Zixibacteria bacterium]
MDESRLFSNQRGRLPRKESIALADYIIRKEKVKLPVNIIFTDDAYITELNSRFRQKHQPTDVLSFNSDPELEILGEIYVSIDTARRQANDYCVPLRNEILRLVCHGVLHLCGYEHSKKADRENMRNFEDKYLSKFTELKNA